MLSASLLKYAKVDIKLRRGQVNKKSQELVMIKSNLVSIFPNSIKQVDSIFESK